MSEHSRLSESRQCRPVGGPPPVSRHDAGRMPYGDCLALQARVHAGVAAGTDPARVIFVEHPPVLTLGKHAQPGHLLATEAYLGEQGIGLFRIERGGEVTAHEPGQLVVYPILRLADWGFSARGYVDFLERCVISTLAGFGIGAATDPAYPGVWVGPRKICAIGIRIKDRATLHGIALNVTNDLRLFEMIVPCGIKGRGVTSMARELTVPVTVSAVADRLWEVMSGELAESIGPR